MEKQKLPELMFMTIVYDVTDWSDVRLEKLVYNEDAKMVSCTNSILEVDELRAQLKQRDEEIKQLKWMMTEHD